MCGLKGVLGCGWCRLFVFRGFGVCGFWGLVGGFKEWGGEVGKLPVRSFPCRLRSTNRGL